MGHILSVEGGADLNKRSRNGGIPSLFLTVSELGHWSPAFELGLGQTWTGSCTIGSLGSGPLSSHDHVNQFLIINTFMCIYIYPSCWFCFSGETPSYLKLPTVGCLYHGNRQVLHISPSPDHAPQQHAVAQGASLPSKAMGSSLGSTCDR